MRHRKYMLVTILARPKLFTSLLRLENIKRVFAEEKYSFEQEFGNLQVSFKLSLPRSCVRIFNNASIVIEWNATSEEVAFGNVAILLMEFHKILNILRDRNPKLQYCDELEIYVEGRHMTKGLVKSTSNLFVSAAKRYLTVGIDVKQKKSTEERIEILLGPTIHSFRTI